MLVMKFGGTSVGSAESIRQSVSIIRSNQGKSPIVVVSAISKVTDMLIAAAERAAKGDVYVDDIRERHLEVIRALKLDAALVEPELNELEHVLTGIYYVRKVIPELYAMTVSFGERMSSKIVAAYARSVGLNAVAYNSFDLGLLTDSNYKEAEVLPQSYGGISAALGNVSDGEIPVITGFIAKDESGSITTLGRGGSDYTASIFAAASNSGEVQIWTDVDGMMTADPKIVPSARTIPEISFREASELAYFGAKVIHPKTILPAVQKNIPVRVLNTFNPKAQGTVIVETSDNPDVITAIACKRGISTINISSPRMLFAYGFMERIFEVFAKHRISVDMISTSEVSVSMTVDAKYDLSSIVSELSSVGTVSVAGDRASISVVGRGIKSTPGVEGVIFSALGAASINVEMISMGASEINISFVVDGRNANDAVRLIHKAFFEHNQQTIKRQGASQANQQGGG